MRGGFPSDLGSSAGGASTGSSGSAFGTGSAAGSGSAPGSRASSSPGRTSRLASPAAAQRTIGRDKPTRLLLLYLLWQSLVIGTVASLYLWRKAAA